MFFLFLVSVFIFFDQNCCQRMPSHLINSQLFINDLKPYSISFAENAPIWNYDSGDLAKDTSDEEKIDDISDYGEADDDANEENDLKDTSKKRNKNERNLNQFDLNKDDEQFSFYKSNPAVDSVTNFQNLFATDENQFQSADPEDGEFMLPIQKTNFRAYRKPALINFLKDNDFDDKANLNDQPDKRTNDESKNVSNARIKGKTRDVSNNSNDDSRSVKDDSRDKQIDDSNTRQNNGPRDDSSYDLSNDFEEDEKLSGLRRNQSRNKTTVENLMNFDNVDFDNLEIKFDDEDMNRIRQNQTDSKQLTMSPGDKILMPKRERIYVSKVIYSSIPDDQDMSHKHIENIEHLGVRNYQNPEQKGMNDHNKNMNNHKTNMNDQNTNMNDQNLNKRITLPGPIDFVDEPSREPRIRELRRLRRLRRPRIGQNNATFESQKNSPAYAGLKEHSNEIKSIGAGLNDEIKKLNRVISNQGSQTNTSRLATNHQIAGQSSRSMSNDQPDLGRLVRVVKVIKKNEDNATRIDVKKDSISNASTSEISRILPKFPLTRDISLPKLIILPRNHQVNETMKLNLTNNRTVDDYIDEMEDSGANKNKIKRVLY